MDGSNGRNDNDALADNVSWSCFVYLLLKCPKWRPRLLITHRLSEETNNKWHPESNSIQTGRQAESEALQGGGLGGSRDINI